MDIILENAVEREIDVRMIDFDNVMKKCAVIYMDVGYADIASLQGCNLLEHQQ